MSATPTPDAVNVSSAGSSAQLPNHRLPHWSARQHREFDSSQGDGVRRPAKPKNNRNRQKPASATGAVAQGGTPESTSSTAQTGGTPSTKPNRRARNAKPVGPPMADTESGEKTVHADFKDVKIATVEKSLNQRRPKFDGKLSEPTQKAGRRSETKKSHPQKDTIPQQDDLTSTLIRDLSTPPYPDCLICFSAIHPMQPTWSCSPLIPISSNDGPEDGTNSKQNQTAKTPQYCWNTFHLKCIRPWASKSVKDLEDAWRARGENKRGEWRCPGCQSKRMNIPTSYWCFCGSTPDPKPPRLATPHSCASPCSRTRDCGHHCSLPCHPGPCPPCQVTIQLPCYCGKQTLSYRCSNLVPGRHGAGATLSCGKPCGKGLTCGNHNCEEPCHDGPCPPCSIRILAKCYCGQTEKELACGEGHEKTSFVREEDGESEWTGLFECDKLCGRPFDCGVHHCEKHCHPPSPDPAHCPRSPSLVTHCPCGKHTLDPSSAPYFPPNAILTRTACTDPIPTCESTCMKPLEDCSHTCAARCHTGSCPPCSISVVRPCRCGQTTRNVPCHEDKKRTLGMADEILCDKPCLALRACGRHQCSRICCPLASLAHLGKGKGKKKASAVEIEALAGESGWHECDLVCGKLLNCGLHQCEEKDHRGACPPCLRSSFEEMVCHCGRTVLEPPIPCGTTISCSYPCSRPPPPCGHSKTQHACHEDPIPCPACPFLTNKLCACGKKVVGNVRCSQERVSCGTICGKLLSCGFHHCERLCHGDDCGSCHAICGKARKLCLPSHHACTLFCHAPAACSEAEPCRTPITLTCPCGRIRQQVPCGRSTLNPGGLESSQQLRCTNECALAKRNARLAEALGINPEARSAQVTYTDELVNSAKSDVKFCLLVEKTFAEFIASDKKTQVLPQMPPQRRKFVHDLADAYRMDTQMVDQEPYRSVQLIRRLDSRLPTPLLSASASAASTSSTTTSLGKLTDLRAPIVQAPRPAWGPGRSQTSTPVPSQASGRGWTSVVAPKPQARTQARPSPTPSPTPRVSGTSAGGRTGTPLGAVHPPPSTTLTVPAAVSVDNPATSNDEDVPDNWEDDV